MRAPRQPEACRRNRTKSQAPTTQDGKGRSARNALTFGLDFSVILRENEDPADFARLEATCKGHWNTTTPAEADLVVDIVNARWRLRLFSEVDAENHQNRPRRSGRPSRCCRNE